MLGTRLSVGARGLDGYATDDMGNTTCGGFGDTGWGGWAGAGISRLVTLDAVVVRAPVDDTLLDGLRGEVLTDGT